MAPARTAESSDQSLRVFFALWPPPDVARRLHQIGRPLKQGPAARSMRLDTLHLTLAFVGEVEAGRLDALKAIGAAIRLPSFELRLDFIDRWPHNDIAWVGCSEPSAVLPEFAATLRDALSAQGFPVERRGFTPHLTLLRKSELPSARQAVTPVVWPVTEFVLVRSRRMAHGANYEVLARWPSDPAAVAPVR